MVQPLPKIDLQSLRDGDLEELRKFSKSQFDEGNILSTASELKYVRELKRALAGELSQPSDEFSRLLIGHVYPGAVTAKIRAQFIPFIEKAYQAHLSDVFSERLKGVLGNSNGQSMSVTGDVAPSQLDEEEVMAASDTVQEVETTPEEQEAFLIIRAIGAAETQVQRIVMRDVQSYCGVLFDDNNRKPICRLYFNSKKLAVGIFDGEGRSETRYSLDQVTDIYQHTDAIRRTIRRYLPQVGEVPMDAEN